VTKSQAEDIKARIVAMAEAVAKETGVAVPYHIGTMIELPRAALRAMRLVTALSRHPEEFPRLSEHALDALERIRRMLSAGVQEALALESGFLKMIAHP
jgi:hypothetical protein